MSAAELIEQFKALPPNERAQVAKFVVENDDSWIPESLREGMADAEAGRVVDLMSRIPATNEVSIPSHSHILAEFRKAVAPTTD